MKSLGRRCISIRKQLNTKKDILVSILDGRKKKRSQSDNMSAALKLVTTALKYPYLKGIPVYRVVTHSLISGGANALSLAGYSDRDIQKMGRWRGETFKEYIREELHCFVEGMSTAMKQDIKIFNITGGGYNKLVNVTRTTVVIDYQPVTE